ncbi:glutathione S-transferase 1-1-like [Ochlerotatus camptorhynchus]|uniref:glutathione S-transferase 1-1-like n=1 Tax=Ochlerotatus camptorhynchus TaxID=644619 RepID=UPI0031DC1870
MALDLYHMPASAPCQSVRLLAKAMKLQLNLIHLDLSKEEHMKPQFLKLNPQHVIPTLVDNDFVLWESRAILIYLCEKYGKNDKFYPRDPKKRAVINQRLYFDLGTLYDRFADCYYPLVFEGQKFDEENFKKLEEAFGFLEIYLGQNTYVAGDKITIADFSILASITTMKVCAEIDFSKYGNIERWYAQLAEEVADHDDVCVQGALGFQPHFQAAKKAAEEQE